MKAKLYTLTSKTTKEVELPAGLFGRKVKPVVLAQAVRVLTSRQHVTPAKAKTRGDLTRTTAKVYAQKHTGRARHGARSAPIFVGGGVTHGPKGLVGKTLKLTRKMRRLSILGALNLLADSGSVSVIANLDKAPAKTQDLAQLTQKISAKKPILFLTNKPYPTLQQAARNIPNLTLSPATNANTLSLLKTKNLLIDQAALETLETWLLAKKTDKPTKKSSAVTQKTK
jgi:large subunit ribosomal protein L4